MSPKRLSVPSLAILAALLAAFAASSCGIGPFERSATVELSLSFPDDPGIAPAGLIAAVQDEAAAEGRVFDPTTAYIRAVISAPDMGRPVVLMAPYVEGLVSLRLVAPVGTERRLEVTALDAERSFLTRGETEFEVTKGLTTLTLWMKPVDELLPPENAIPVGPQGLYIAPEALVSGTTYFYADLPVEAVYRHDMEFPALADPSPSPSTPINPTPTPAPNILPLPRARIQPPSIRVYDAEGKLLPSPAADDPFPGRFASAAGRIYVAVSKPVVEEGLRLRADIDWRPTVLGLTYAAEPEGELDSRDPLTLEFPNELSGASFAYLGLSGDVASSWETEGKILVVYPPLASSALGDEWYNSAVYNPTSLLAGDFHDPILGIDRYFDDMGIDMPVRTYMYLAPGRDDPSSDGRRTSPMGSMGGATALCLSAGSTKVRYILAEGSYDEAATVTASGETRISGGWTPGAAGPWTKDQGSRSVIRMGGPADAPAEFVMNGFCVAEDLVFKHLSLSYASPPPPTQVVTLRVKDDSYSGQMAYLERCSVYSPGFKSTNEISNSTTAAIILDSSAAGLRMNRCALNWPADPDPLSKGGTADLTGVSFFTGHRQCGIAQYGGSLSAFNSIIAAGSLAYASDDTPSSQPELNAVYAALSSAGNLSLVGNSLLSGTCPTDPTMYATIPNRFIVSTNISGISIGNLFLNQTRPPLSDNDPPLLDAYGFYSVVTASHTLDFCAFSRFVSDATSYAANFTLDPEALNVDVIASTDPYLKPLADSVLLGSSVPADAVITWSAFLTQDFYGSPRGDSLSVGAVEYR